MEQKVRRCIESIGTDRLTATMRITTTKQMFFFAIWVSRREFPYNLSVSIIQVNHEGSEPAVFDSDQIDRLKSPFALLVYVRGRQLRQTKIACKE